MTLEQNLLFANRYKLIRQLGRGGFSEVWLAEDSLTSVQIAVKVYAPGTGLDEQGIEMFTKEFSMVFDMNHTNLLRPTHFDCWERMPYLIMPYCKNGSAFSYITSDNIITEDECWNMFHDVAAGLAYLHDKVPPLIHQDIKPDNILVSDEGNFMITDFGISARVRSTIRGGMSQEQSGGTMAYMGPERFSKNPTPIMASDVWSLGAMMYELMTGGNPPFENWGGAKQKNGAEIPDIEQDFSDELKRLVYSCLALEPWDRPSARKVEEIAYNHLHGIVMPQEKNEQPTVAEQVQDTVKPAEPAAQQPDSQPYGQAPLQQPASQAFEQPAPPAASQQPAQGFEQQQPVQPSYDQPASQDIGAQPADQQKPFGQNTADPTAPQTTPLGQPSVKKSQPIKQGGGKGKIIGLAAGAVVLIGILVAIFAGSGGSKADEEAAAAAMKVNYDSLANAKIDKATAIRLEADTIMSNHPDDWSDEKYGKVEDIYVKALDELNTALDWKDSLDSSTTTALMQQKASIDNALKNILGDFQSTINNLQDAGVDPSAYETRAAFIRRHVGASAETPTNETQNNETQEDE